VLCPYFPTYTDGNGTVWPICADVPLRIYSLTRCSWLGLLTCKNRLPYNLYCVGGDVKHCTIQSKSVQRSVGNVCAKMTLLCVGFHILFLAIACLRKLLCLLIHSRA